MSEIIERIEREAGVPGLAAILAERLTPTDLQSLLLEVHRRRSARRRPAEVLAAYKTDRFVQPSAVSPNRLAAWEACALAQLPPEFEALALSPLCPAGTCSSVASVPADWSVATVRRAEVVSDSTNVLALECSLRRRALLERDPKSAAAVHLAASHRLLRAQRYDSPQAVTHFSSFALCSAGRDQGNQCFEVSCLRLHIGFYLRALRAFLGPDVPLRVRLTDLAAGPESVDLERELLAPLQQAHPAVEVRVDAQRTAGRGYYAGLCFHLDASLPSGERLELVDGGVVDWTAKLLGSAKERLVVSGIGSERLCARF